MVKLNIGLSFKVLLVGFNWLLLLILELLVNSMQLRLEVLDQLSNLSRTRISWALASNLRFGFTAVGRSLGRHVIDSSNSHRIFFFSEFACVVFLEVRSCFLPLQGWIIFCGCAFIGRTGDGCIGFARFLLWDVGLQWNICGRIDCRFHFCCVLLLRLIFLQSFVLMGGLVGR